ncbi:MAG: hypothetical protein AB1640_07520 [bacterium]
MLGNLSAKTQIIFFSHHDRLVELTRKASPGDILSLDECHMNPKDNGFSCPPGPRQECRHPKKEVHSKGLDKEILLL